MLRHLRAQVEDWHDGCRELSAWEEANLLQNPAPERLAEHAAMLDELERVGRWFARAVQGQDYPDQATAELVSLVLRDLQDRRAMWHGNSLTAEKAEEIVRGCFPNEP